MREGGGRKGLPRSFLNRFTRVAVEAMETSDLEAVRPMYSLPLNHISRDCSEAAALLT